MTDLSFTKKEAQDEITANGFSSLSTCTELTENRSSFKDQKPLAFNSKSEENVTFAGLKVNKDSVHQSRKKEASKSETALHNFQFAILQNMDQALIVQSMFHEHAIAVTGALHDCANELVFGTDSAFRYPNTIISCIYDYCIRWRWTTPSDFVTFEQNDEIMRVLKRSVERTAHVDGIRIGKNECYLFECKYIAGTDMDAVIGIMDKRWSYDYGAHASIANQTDCFNWALRFDGIICFQDARDKWKDKVCDRWQDNDVIHIKVDTTHLEDGISAVNIWINGKALPVCLLLSDYPAIEYPLYLGVSAARNGGFQLIKGIKLHGRS